MGLLGNLFGQDDSKKDGAPSASAQPGAAVQSEMAAEATAKPMVPADRIEDLAGALKDATRMTAFSLRIDPDKAPTLSSSKLGGLPYWPQGLDYPEPERKGLSADERLALLAQLDLADFDGDPRLPDHGILQFYVTTDDLNGLEFDVPMDAQRHFRVVWHEQVDSTVTADDVLARGILPASKDDIFPVSGEHALTVERTECWMTPSDERFDKEFHGVLERLFGADYVDSERWWADYLEDDDCDRLDDLLNMGNAMQSLVLGYPYFTQWDPRGEDTVDYFDTLLLQIDSDLQTPSRVMWGDSGVGNFFINGEALAKGDFTRVLYNWDCY